MRLKEGGDQEATKTFTDATLTLEMDRAVHDRRFQNIPEDKEQDLTELITESLADVLDMEANEMKRKINQAYRVNSSYARTSRIPHKVHVIFVRRVVRDRIFKITYEKLLTIQGKEIMILKQIPWKIRDIRRQYLFLTNKLNVKEINFRWLVPEGITVNWQSRRYRLDSVEKAKDFDRKYFPSTEEQEVLPEIQEEKRERESNEDGNDRKATTRGLTRKKYNFRSGCNNGDKEENQGNQPSIQTVMESNLGIISVTINGLNSLR